MVLSDSSYIADVIGNVHRIRSNLCTCEKNSNYDAHTFENDAKKRAESHIAGSYAHETYDLYNLGIFVIPVLRSSIQNAKPFKINLVFFFFKSEQIVLRIPLRGAPIIFSS